MVAWMPGTAVVQLFGERRMMNEHPWMQFRE